MKTRIPIRGTITWRAQLPAYPFILDVFLDLNEPSCREAGVTSIQVATYYVGDDMPSYRQILQDVSGSRTLCEDEQIYRESLAHTQEGAKE